MDTKILNYTESKTKVLKRKSILTNTRKLFIENGIHSYTMKQIAQANDISLRSLYYYYRSKDELAIDIQIVTFEEYYNLTTQIDFEDNSGYNLLKKYMYNIINIINNNQHLIEYITVFDYYFYEGYPTDKYSNYINNFNNSKEFKILYDKLLEDETIDCDTSNVSTILSTMLQSMIAYAGRIIYREKAFKETNQYKNTGDLKLFVDILLKGISR